MMQAAATTMSPGRSLAPVHVGRQPIYDAQGGLTAYELLFRHTPGAEAAAGAGDDATTATILAAFTDFDAGTLLAGRRGFINLTASFLTERLPVPFAPDAAVLEVLETVRVDDEVLAGLGRLVDRGFTVALDDYVWSPETASLLDLASIVKIDVLGQTWDDVLETATRCRRDGMTLLAEKIEDDDMLRRCRDAGFELFQGYHLGRPTTLSASTLTPNQAGTLTLLTRLSDPRTTAGDVEDLLRADPALAYRLLRIANSSANGLRRRVSSIRDAVVIVGLAQLRSWVALLTLPESGAAAVALTATLVRARACELLAQARRMTGTDAAFTLGLLDGLAEVFGLTGPRFLDLVPPLAPVLTAALSGHGQLADLLRDVRQYERGEQGASTAPEVADAYIAALSWAGRISTLVDGGSPGGAAA